jgi:hypothetical protein
MALAALYKAVIITLFACIQLFPQSFAGCLIIRCWSPSAEQAPLGEENHWIIIGRQEKAAFYEALSIARYG